MNRTKDIPSSLQFLFFFVFLVLILSTSFFMSQMKPTMAVAVALGVGIFLVSFLDTNVALFILILSMLLSPEIGQRTVSGEGMTLRIEDFLLFIIAFGWLAKNAYYKHEEELGLLRKTPLNPYIFGYIVVCAFATAMGMLGQRVSIKTGFLFVVKYFEYVIVYFILVNHLHKKRQIRDYTILLLLTCLIVCIMAVVQIPRGVRVTAPFEGSHGEPNTLGGYLILMLSITLGLLFTTEFSNIKVGLGILSLIIAFVLLYTLSRSSWLAAFAMILFFIFLLKPKLRMVAILITLAGMLILVFFAPSRVKERVSETFVEEKISARHESIFGKRVDESTSARIADWKDGLRDWVTKHFIVGFGITGYHFMDAQYIRVAVETGIIGIFAFFLLIKAIYKNAWFSYQNVNCSLYKGLSLGYLAGLIGLLAHSIGTNTFIIVRIMEPFWFLTGMVIMLPELERHEQITAETLESIGLRPSQDKAV